MAIPSRVIYLFFTLVSVTVCCAPLRLNDDVTKPFVAPDTSTWEEITTSGARPLPRYGHKAVVFDGKMIVFGGHAATTYLNDLLALDLGMKPILWV